ncbi:DUF1761 domain-containing protein [Notoacmeibacter sp. MSK16QG-6]|uniref:DUF1761 domain-containing protein n=1 Tax=Notoacmeibacter sp. MSK16QG-6 TaxID=2957982 RepID=UPI0020A0EB01|nr:DUF1761 domain-containing protein [Notoacmeibacter sp. MSK16QG-6]MCP1199255.1 DUF1761 domain-containing protein [Notoacmeibacter sp. MSK16QG-6]
MTVNWLAIFVAAIAAFAFGAAWYMALSKPWIRVARVNTEAMNRKDPTPFIVSFVAELVMAWVLTGIIFHATDGAMGISEGLLSGLLAWLGFMLTTIAVNQRYQGFSWTLTVIDAGHWLGVALIQGAILGWMGV